MTRGARIAFVLTLAPLLVGAASPARGQSEPAADATTPATPAREEGSTIRIIQEAPPLTAPIPDPGAPPQQQVRVLVRRHHPGLVIPGAVIFGATYVASLYFSLLEAATSVDCYGETCDNNAWAFLIPVGGPTIAWLAERKGSPALWVGWSTVQAVGAFILAVGLVGHDVPEWRPIDGGPRVRVVPAATPQSGALSLDVSW